MGDKESNEVKQGVPYNPAVLKTILFRDGIGIKEAATMLKSSEIKVGQWTERGGHPGWASIYKIADVFNVSTYMLSPKRTAGELSAAGILPDMRTRLFYLMEIEGITVAELSDACGLKPYRIREYLDGQKASDATAERIATPLGATGEFLKCGTGFSQQELSFFDNADTDSGHEPDCAKQETEKTEPFSVDELSAHERAEDEKTEYPVRTRAEHASDTFDEKTGKNGNWFYSVIRDIAEHEKELTQDQKDFLISMLR